MVVTGQVEEANYAAQGVLYDEGLRQVAQICDCAPEEVVLEHRLVRLQTAVRTDWPQAQRFAQFFGLENEGLMKKYGPDGTDYFRYSRVYEWV